jgi:hypothetical protein
MKLVLAAIIALPCDSPVHVDEAFSTTVVYACPNTVSYRWEERPETPMDYARQRHYWSLPRDDRPPIAVKEEKPKVAKAVKRKTKRKKKRRRN